MNKNKNKSEAEAEKAQIVIYGVFKHHVMMIDSSERNNFDDIHLTVFKVSLGFQ